MKTQTAKKLAETVERLIDDYHSTDKIAAFQTFFIGSAGDSTEAENAKYLCLEVVDYDNNHDFSALRRILSTLNLELDTLETYTGDFSGHLPLNNEAAWEEEWVEARLFGVQIPIFADSATERQDHSPKEKRRKLSAFEVLERELGQSSALGILNELIGERMQAEHPEYDDLNGMDKDILWDTYCQRYSGDNAEELLAPYIEENFGEED